MTLKSILWIGVVFLQFSAFADWKFYPYHAENSQITFPKDEGRHIGVPNLEWWYSVMHLTGKNSGNQYSVLVSHFNNDIRFFNITNITKQIHTSGSTAGILNSQFDHLELTQKTPYGIDSFKTKRDAKNQLIPFEYEIQTHHKDIDIAIELEALKKPMMIGGTGYVPVGSSGHTYYYSITELKAEGNLTQLGISEPVEGIAWIDHQWGPFLVSPVAVGGLFETYEWFCIQLDNHQELMVSNIFNRKNQIPNTAAYGGVQLIQENGDAVHTQNRKFTRTAFWKDAASQNTMSMGWALDLPEYDIHLKLAPEMLDQMVKMPLHGSFWEGSIQVSGTSNGKPVRGKAFGELIHRYQNPQIEIDALKPIWNRNEKLTLTWKIKNADAGNLLHYSVSVVDSANGEKLIAKQLSVPYFEINSADVFSTSTSVKLKITAYSIDETISSSAETTEIKLSE